ncbi:MAG: hypothetical protein CO093_10465 [Alphaproteobacteria bacterium CG_4_9_14_3_um_filter_47_13]|nr:MAG: hypothetical protein CO093_10465 [Alphaproteobacteria bacterium CG_4_9_14_3_um_filter_47_13]
MNKKAQLVIGMLLGFEKDHEVYTDVEWNSDMARALLDVSPVSKEDIFSLLPNGKSFFEYPEAWKNFQKLIDFTEKNNEAITIDDIARTLENNKSVVKMAADCKMLSECFSPQLWKGHSAEMEDLWYSLEREQRAGKDFTGIRRAVASLEGNEIREDHLQRIGVSPADVFGAIRNGVLVHVIKILESKEDHIRLEDILTPDYDGDHALYNKRGWDSFADLYRHLKKHNEIPDAEFFLFKRGKAVSLVESAFDNYSEQQIFNATVFEGRPDELLKLYEACDDARKGKVDIYKVLKDIVENKYENEVTINENISAENLTEILYVPPEEKTEWHPLIPLGLKKVWDHIDEISDVLAQKKQSVTLEMLRTPYGFSGETCLHRATKLGKFDKVVSLLQENGQRLENKDLLTRDKEGKNIIEILSGQHQLDVILKPEIWAGRVGSLTEIWNAVPADEKSRKKSAFQVAQTKANQMSLRQLVPN